MIRRSGVLAKKEVVTLCLGTVPFSTVHRGTVPLDFFHNIFTARLRCKASHFL